MSLPDYFGKVALSAAHVLQHFDPATFSALLEGRVVGLHFDDAAASRLEGRHLLDLLVRLLARLYPNLVISGPPYVEELASLARRINPGITLLPAGVPEDVIVVVGEQAAQGSARVIYAGSDGWVAYLSNRQPVMIGRTGNPFGAGVAACLAAANVFRIIFAASLQGEPDDEVEFSVLSLSGDGKGRGSEVGKVNLGEAHLAGVGAVGQACVWALAGVPELTGTLWLVDDERLDLGNLQRYVLSEQGQLDATKVELASAHLRPSDLTVLPHQASWAAHAHERGWQLEWVAVALDSAEDRIALQATLPHKLVNAWTQTGDLGVSRHNFLEGPCLACLYHPRASEKSRSMLVAESIGLADRESEVRALLALGTPLSEAFVRDIAAATGVPPEQLLPFIDQPLQTFYSQAVCGGMILQAGGQHGFPRAAEVPLAFQSAMAGVLLAAELLVQAGDLRPEPIPTVTLMDLTRPLGKELSQPRAKIEGCICQDQDYVARYQDKYMSAGAASLVEDVNQEKQG